MKEGTLTNSFISVKNKKTKSKINAKTSSTNIDSNSQKSNSNSNSNIENNHIYINRDLKTNLRNKHISNNNKNNYLLLPINELKQFRTWNSSNLNAIYQNILANDKENYLHIKPKFNNHFDITDIHRTILVDWLINVHLYFKLTDECLYLSIKLIDIFLARTNNFTKNKLQLLGICSLQISAKYIEQIHPSIKNLTDLCDKCYKKNEIIQFEKYLLQVNDYIIEQNQLLNYYDLLCLILKFNVKYYYFGKMLLDLTLLDINFYKYRKNTIIFSICSIIIYNSKAIDDITDDFDEFIKGCKDKKYKLIINDGYKYESSNNDSLYNNNIINNINYLFSFYPYKDYSSVFECNKAIYELYENIKISKYNSAIQKYFIQLKEIKNDSILEPQNEIISDNRQNSQYKNETKEQKEDIDEESNDNINMIIIE